MSSSPFDRTTLSRRALLRGAARTSGALGLSMVCQAACPSLAIAAPGGADDFGTLLPPDGNGLMLPPGFTSRIVAVTGSVVAGTSYTWHAWPDGGATFPTVDGGWIYVSNAELTGGNGGVGAIRFSQTGAIIDAYSILSGTSSNCAGGATPWGTWLSCEERLAGQVYECDPWGASAAVLLPALGTFAHEAAAVDPIRQRIYLTEDKADSLLYRFTPTSYPDLSAGVLEAAEIPGPGALQPGGASRAVTWHPVPNAQPAGGGVQNDTHLPLEERATRYQVPAATSFQRGEGCSYDDGFVYFSTTTDSRVWKLNSRFDRIEILYDPTVSANPVLASPDNVLAAPGGDVYVAEDGHDLQIVALTCGGDVKPILQLTGQTGTELTGPALSPNGKRLYFSSQRNPGTTYEVSGPFLAKPIELPTLRGTGSAVLGGALAAAAAWRLREREERG